MTFTLIFYLVSATSWIPKVKLNFAKMGKMHYSVGKSHTLLNTEQNILFRTKYIWNILIIQKWYWLRSWSQSFKKYIFKIFILTILFYYLWTFISNNTDGTWLQFKSIFFQVCIGILPIFFTLTSQLNDIHLITLVQLDKLFMKLCVNNIFYAWSIWQATV